MEGLYIFLLICIIIVKCEKCVWGNVQCECSDDIKMVMCKDSYLKEIKDIEIPQRITSKVRVLDLQYHCLTDISLVKLAKFSSLKTLSIKNQHAFLSSDLKHIESVCVISDCIQIKIKSSFLTQILTAASSFSSPDVKATSSTATSMDRPSKFITSKPRTTVAVTKSHRNTTFHSRKLPPKMSFINITTSTASTGEITGYNIDDMNIITLPVLSNSSQESTLKIEIIVALSTITAGVFFSVTICVCNLCVCVKYDRSCGLHLRAICVCGKIPDSHLQRIRFPACDHFLFSTGS